ncbi:MAG: M42 family peptidase [Clostridia bacterium]|nr:M42 family peptidase [Clostridia bacterium]
MLKLTEKLCNLYGPSGLEDEVRNAIIEEISPYCEKIYTDKVGNLIAYKKGKKSTDKPLLFAAHMDEVGFMLQYISQDGYLYFDTIGGIDNSVIGGRRLVIGENKLLGVVASKAIHLQKPEERGMCIPISEMYIDIGCKTKEDAKKHVSVGDCGVFEPNFEEFGDGFIKSKAIDDRFGCAVLCTMIKEEREYDTMFVFTVCEEVGCRGAQTAAYSLNPECTVVIESTTAGDIYGVAAERRACKVGDGAVLTVMDGGTVYDKQFLDKAVTLAKENSINYQIKNTVAGGNDSRAFQTTAKGSRVLAISAPVRYIHSASSVVKKTDLEDVLALARLVADNGKEI